MLLGKMWLMESSDIVVGGTGYFLSRSKSPKNVLLSSVFGS